MLRGPFHWCQGCSFFYQIQNGINYENYVLKKKIYNLENNFSVLTVITSSSLTLPENRKPAGEVSFKYIYLEKKGKVSLTVSNYNYLLFFIHHLI